MKSLTVFFQHKELPITNSISIMLIALQEGKKDKDGEGKKKEDKKQKIPTGMVRAVDIVY